MTVQNVCNQGQTNSYAFIYLSKIRTSSCFNSNIVRDTGRCRGEQKTKEENKKDISKMFPSTFIGSLHIMVVSLGVSYFMFT